MSKWIPPPIAETFGNLAAVANVITGPTRATTKLPRRIVAVYKRSGAWGWKFHVNGYVMAQSAGTYTRRRQAWRAFDHFRAHLAHGNYQEVTDNVGDGRFL